MRTEDDGGPLVHRVVSDSEYRREAQMGLDELLAQGRLIRDREARERAAKKTEEELEVARQRRMRKAQEDADRFAYKPIAALAMFEEQTCRNCGSVHSMFRGYGTLYQRKSSFDEKWERADCLDRGLPFQMRTMPGATPVCSECIGTFSAPADLPPYEFVRETKGE